MGGNMGGIIVLIVLLLLAIAIFFIYFVFKQIQFVLEALNLYKDIRNREDMIIKLLKDILDKIPSGTNVTKMAIQNSDNQKMPSEAEGKPTTNIGGKPFVAVTLNTIGDLLAKFGYELRKTGDKWIMKLPAGGETFIYSANDLKNDAQKIAAKNGIEISWGD